MRSNRFRQMEKPFFRRTQSDLNEHCSLDNLRPVYLLLRLMLLSNYDLILNIPSNDSGLNGSEIFKKRQIK